MPILATAITFGSMQVELSCAPDSIKIRLNHKLPILYHPYNTTTNGRLQIAALVVSIVEANSVIVTLLLN